MTGLSSGRNNSRKEIVMPGTKDRGSYPEDLVGAVIFFASSDSDFITGQTLVVDGGDVKH